ncbi:hypothetical protein [Duganella sp. Root1480D1]|uniref:hypothetical protein n=1 Tax=Duganella sp. Root1480D1 TaxID=1736471 RepID=UPI000709A6F8|nr:hypothetical protein [Duganella sp. Root1480D1]KQZ26317.1 hypothetical protein ASD58_16900 [Duganella sp. Root1480D1]
MPNNIDPFAYEEDLTKLGVPAAQAHVHAEAIGKVKCELEILDSKMKSSDDEDKVGRGLAELNTKIDRTKAELEAKIDLTKAELAEKIHRAKIDIICWTVGIVISVCTLQGYVIVNMLK